MTIMEKLFHCQQNESKPTKQRSCSRRIRQQESLKSCCSR